MDRQRRPADDLMARAARSDREAFGDLAELVGPAVYRFCLAHLHPARRDEADDARQETFLRAWRARKRFRPGGGATGWLLGIAMNVLRERRRRRPTRALGGLDPPSPARPETDERLGALAEAVEALPDRQREAVACRFFRGLSVAQTARAMGVAEGTVKAAVFQAIGNLRRLMKGKAE